MATIHVAFVLVKEGPIINVHDIFLSMTQWCIQDFCEGGAGRGGPSQGEGAGGAPTVQSADAFDGILYLVYETSWFHVHRAVAAFNKYYNF